MGFTKLVMTLLILIGAGYIYEKLKLREEKDKNLVDYDLVRKYLLDDNSLAENKKPILWIHISYNINAREWCSFMSRNTNNLNQPYLYLTVKSIIDKCGDDFFICLIDDDAFKNLLPTWDVDLHKLGNPLKEHFRKLALANVLYNYGGLLVPNSFICCQSLMPLYEQYTKNKSMFVGEFLDHSISSSISDFSPNTRLMACTQNSEMMGEFISYLERLNSNDYTAEANFIGTESDWCKDKLQANQLGIKDSNNKPIVIEELLSSNFLELQTGAVGMYVPAEQLLKRINYNWFAYLSPEEVLKSDTQIGKRLLICND